MIISTRMIEIKNFSQANDPVPKTVGLKYQ